MNRLQSGKWTAASEGIARALAWWKDQLAALVPMRLKQAFVARPRQLVLTLGPDGYSAHLVHYSLWGLPSRQQDMETVPADGAVDAPQRIRRAGGPLTVARVAIPEDQCLVLARDIPASALGHVETIMSLELERKTPFERDAVFCGTIVDPPDAVRPLHRARHVIIKKSRIGWLIEALNEARIPLAETVLVTRGGSEAPVTLLGGHVRPLKSVDKQLKQLVSWATLGVASLATAWFVASIWRQQESLDRLEQEVASAKSVAIAARRERSRREELDARVASLYRRKATEISMLGLWEEITRLLPDTAWLIELRREDDVLVLDGYSRAASDLIGLFSRSAIASKAEFLSPVIRDPQNGMERFKLKVKLRNAVAGSTGKAK